MKKSKKDMRVRSHRRIRRKISGTQEQPRLAVFRSLKQIYVQAIDDVTGHTIASASTLEKEFKSGGKYGGNIDAAKFVGSSIAKRLLDKGISTVVFDRGGFQYHGRVQAVAEAAREAGLKF
ncbi:50S ribosomal protein L18 [Sulfidibacter corallicola]|uniref:Large ribosomal subunit protein uL18 n=1 Tax=Sulfidibacter corallicola TaxID=2818388 RepID=A0A8A4TD55_SULCO|nr:50S ribosomal protein L18 [Sulfidibacter corallicola]QTD47866.1 50S ribosomal protein L18 [Sulfidibacter corallicola]